MTLFCVHLETDQPQTGVSGVVRQGSMGSPSHTKSHPNGSISSSQLGGPPFWASTLGFGPTECNVQFLKVLKVRYDTQYLSEGIQGTLCLIVINLSIYALCSFTNVPNVYRYTSCLQTKQSCKTLEGSFFSRKNLANTEGKHHKRRKWSHSLIMTFADILLCDLFNERFASVCICHIFFL